MRPILADISARLLCLGTFGYERRRATSATELPDSCASSTIRHLSSSDQFRRALRSFPISDTAIVST
ncbi:hypothetical protein EMEDMD4_910023 [Sinorhizobium medicae]|uniref:Uncharacterized protein n=1 Tax=Sinorhizobium medicae TaxID=110321 RepID=A0A508X7G1_9HYPH|nr:hypothetical protein EMEDMD4_910023 [Sinorhizobium medicae]